MRLRERQQQLDALLLAFYDLWHAQPFRERRPAWCDKWPALAAELLALPEAAVVALNDDGDAALNLLARYLPEVTEMVALAKLPMHPARHLPAINAFWDWEIPGRKRAQIEAFAAAAIDSGRPVMDWCGGKGHLGRLLALAWQVPVHSLDFDATLCEQGRALALRAGVDQSFIHADALQIEGWPQAGQHAVALHACGDLHRRLIREGAAQGLPALSVAPCCYHRGVEHHYQPMSGPLQLQLTRDDTRLAVTETVTAKSRETRQRDQAMAWKLGFDAYRRDVGDGGYRNFKPVPDRWMRATFGEFMAQMTLREGLPSLPGSAVTAYESIGWQRRHQVMALSIPRHAFRRALEIWLALDLAVYFEKQGYSVSLGCFCERALTPRNLMVSASLA